MKKESSQYKARRIYVHNRWGGKISAAAAIKVCRFGDFYLTNPLILTTPATFPAS